MIGTYNFPCSYLPSLPEYIMIRDEGSRWIQIKGLDHAFGDQESEVKKFLRPVSAVASIMYKNVHVR